MKQAITYGGVTAEPGTKATGWTPIFNTNYKLPVTVINGTKPGKAVLITSAIHGCEYPSIEAVFELAESINPKDVTGEIVFINPVNVTAFEARRPYILPLDGKNINRLFPGNPDGTVGDQIAYVLTEEFQKKVDFHIDTHGGDVTEHQAPYAYYPSQGNHTEALKLSYEATDYILNAEYVIKSLSRNHAYNYAPIVGTPAVELELGHCGGWSQEEVEQYKENIVNLLRFLKVLPGEAKKRTRNIPHIIKGEYLEATHSGRWYPCIKTETICKKGQKLGEIKDYFGNVLKEYYAEYEGVVIMVVGSLGIQKGDPIITYGLCEK